VVRRLFLELLSLHPTVLTINVILKRIWKNMRASLWYNVYRGRIKSHYLIKAFPNIKFVIPSKDFPSRFDLFNAEIPGVKPLQDRYYIYLTEDGKCVKDIWPPTTIVSLVVPVVSSSGIGGATGRRGKKKQSGKAVDTTRKANGNNSPLLKRFNGDVIDYPNFVVY